ncbi:uncharacterized protein L203_101259 [Cryptococcus depauperatus CBS 7841]|uniref:Uncharacterized protein n=1 Tax=Cryptococcus depauperatus CBS 7841 TaxID=1295531 RepID=A0AAJ8LYW0_9TREE
MGLDVITSLGICPLFPHRTTLIQLCLCLRLSALSFCPQSSCPSVTPSLLPNPPTRKNERSITMSFDSSRSLSEDFLDSCEEVSRTRGSWFRTSSPSTLVRLSFTTYHVAQLKVDEDDEAYISDAKRLSAFYANVAYDFYGAPSGALCVYKNGDA